MDNRCSWTMCLQTVTEFPCSKHICIPIWCSIWVHSKVFFVNNIQLFVMWNVKNKAVHGNEEILFFWKEVSSLFFQPFGGRKKINRLCISTCIKNNNILHLYVFVLISKHIMSCKINNKKASFSLLWWLSKHQSGKSLLFKMEKKANGLKCAPCNKYTICWQ